MSVADRTVHHLVYIHNSSRGTLFNIYYTSCGLKWRLKDEKVLSCSHASMVNCKSCLKTKLTKNYIDLYDRRNLHAKNRRQS